jgi:2-dehydropantoate 2-reductase
MNVLIFGSGAVGLGLGSCLVKSGVQTTLIAGHTTVNALKKDGLYRSGIFGDFHAPPKTFAACTDPTQIQSDTFDFMLVCTKSNHTQTAAEILSGCQHRLKPDGKIVHFQNGWGNAEKFLTCFPKETVYSGRVITGFTRPTPNHVQITVHADAVHIGSLFGAPTEPVEPLCKAIDAGGIPCTAWKDIDKDLWAKMLYNCALNPLGAILDVPYGVLAKNPHSRQIMDAVIEEVYAVMESAGYATYWPTPEQYKEVFYNKLVPPTAEHKSSTLQDLQAGKKTEIDALTGQVIKLAEKAGRKTPTNTTLYNLIRFIEDKN